MLERLPLLGRLPTLEGIRPVRADQQQRWLRLLIITGQLLVTVALAYLGTRSQLELAIMGVVGLAGALFLWRNPALGLGAASFIGMVTPSIGTVNFTVLLVAGLLGLWTVDMVLKKQVRLPNSPVTVPLVVMIVTSLLSFLAGQLHWFPSLNQAPLDAQLAGMAMFIFAAALSLMAASQIRTMRDLQIVTWMFVIVGALYIGSRSIPGGWQFTQIIYSNSAIGGIFWGWFPAICFSQALYNNKLPMPIRLLLGALALATFYVAFGQNYRWKSGWVTTGVALGAVIAVRNWKMMGLAALAAAVVGISQIPGLLDAESYSASTRMEAWIILANIVQVSPLIGLGYGNYYWYTPIYAIRGWQVSFNSHNNYIDVVAQTGVLGLLALVWVFWRGLLLAWRLREEAPEGFGRAYAYGATAGLASTLIVAGLGDWLLPFVYNIGLGGFRTAVIAWLFLGGLMALGRMTREQEGEGVTG